jgi:methyl-accepting chemotaxis protein
MVLIFLVALIALGLNSMSNINSALVTVVESNNIKIDAVTDMRDAQRLIAIAVRNIALISVPAEKTGEEKRVAKAREDYANAMTVLQKLVHSEAGKEILKKIEANRSITIPLVNKVIQLSLDNKSEEAIALLIKEVVPAANKLDVAIGEMHKYQKHNNEKIEETAKHDYASAQVLEVSLSVFRTNDVQVKKSTSLAPAPRQTTPKATLKPRLSLRKI